ncbi:citrate synthase/methylcitrate synthase [Devosia pacifica]|uniref:Citrate synthase n=1 Tax=Devosia pacifica TaxID=1335967 RepID=A0A918SDD4_9HYPH|nr:citrate synthase/methylcitrate synthase [Devosia pacifica]GHA36122.1 citrate synthase/methylcitrate synthase [Devosia pacifica]
MKIGLDDVIAAETRLSEVDGAAGKLTIASYPLEILSQQFSFEQVCAMLLQVGYAQELDTTTIGFKMAAARPRVARYIDHIDQQLARHSVVDAMRAAIAYIPDADDVTTALDLAVAPAVFLPAAIRLSADQAAIPPDASLSHAADMYRMLHGEMPSAAQEKALDTYLLTVSDHGLNASTFAARVVASTGAGLTSSVLAALGALKGPLHGGAPGPVLDMLDAVRSPENAQEWLSAALARGERLMGFGHRIYRVRDPRADALSAALSTLQAAGDIDQARSAVATAVEREALALLKQHKPDRPLHTNVEFFTALLLEALGFPRSAFTGVFAAGRTVGWVAHAREQALHGRLIRPQSHYVGERRQVADNEWLAA